MKNVSFSQLVEFTNYYLGCLVTIVLNMLDEHKLEESEKTTVLTHLEKLIQIDPTHKGYYNDISMYY